MTLTLEPLWEKEGFQSNSHSDSPLGVSVIRWKELIGTQKSAQVLALDLLMKAHGAQPSRMLLASAAAPGGPGETRSSTTVAM